MDNFIQQFQVMTRPMGPDILEQFPLKEGRYSNFIKEVYFVRYIGAGEEKSYLTGICQMDDQLQEKLQKKPVGYLRVSGLDSKVPPEKTGGYSSIYEGRKQGGMRFPFAFQNGMWESALYRNYEAILELYQENSGRKEPALVRNFGVKLLFWMDTYFPKLFLETMKMRSFPKFVCSGEIKLQEYLFLYYLVLMGCDVLYLNPEADVSVDSEMLLRLSCLYEAESKKTVRIPAVFGEEEREKLFVKDAAMTPASGKIMITREYVSRRDRKPPSAVGQVSAQTAEPVKVPGAAVTITDRKEPEAGGSGVRISMPPRPGSRQQTERKPEYRQAGGQPLDYVELAKRAASVVMIGVYNKNKECFKTGSGVIISNKGFILTNFHVASEAAYYGIRLEEEEHIFFTDELVKYNQYHDLAVLRVDRPRTPIPIYQGSQEIVRGQKVVAIGSPLGLFNTVSDGIISGFRKMEDVSMIQFTAPTSHGSSGGALLDLYGNLIGVITAGYDDGQNLNLAVDYKTVWTFARGFV